MQTNVLRAVGRAEGAGSDYIGRSVFQLAFEKKTTKYLSGVNSPQKNLNDNIFIGGEFTPEKYFVVRGTGPKDTLARHG